MDYEALALTLKLASCTTAVLLVLGTPLAAWLSSTRHRARVFIEAVVALPLVLPPTVLGFYLLFLLGPHTWLGALCERLFGSTLPFSFAGLMVGSCLYSLPFLVGPLRSSFAAVDRRLVEASWSLGVSRTSTFLRVIAPLSWPGIVSGTVLTFAHTVGEFGVVLMVGGNIPGATRTVSISIYDQMQSLDYAAASRTSALLLMFSLAVLMGTYTLQRRTFI
ncbi:MAG TPA: molybdate ABC transporter permease subunit [Polyangiaceae bacterium]|nr:molybdate ABC transporter permease subunit [Polyangiaceae bacterium]